MSVVPLFERVHAVAHTSAVPSSKDEEFCDGTDEVFQSWGAPVQVSCQVPSASAPVDGWTIHAFTSTRSPSVQATSPANQAQ
jgi:hypothetical protein